MDEVIRERLADAMARKGVSAAAMAKEIGLDKAYFVDFLAGRKKTITAHAFMLAVTSLGGDPWAMAGVDRGDLPEVHLEREVRRPKREMPPAADPAPLPDLFSRPSGEPEPKLVRLSGLIEETSFRRLPGDGGKADEISYPLMGFHAATRQRLLEVRGGDYASWGVPSGVIVYALSFSRYEGVVSTGRLLVRRRSIGHGLFETVLRRVAVDGEGLVHLESPSGDVKPYRDDDDAETLGMVVQAVTPLPVAVAISV